jgi:hypothetical protein
LEQIISLASSPIWSVELEEFKALWFIKLQLIDTLLVKLTQELDYEISLLLEL